MTPLLGRRSGANPAYPRSPAEVEETGAWSAWDFVDLPAPGDSADVSYEEEPAREDG